MADNPRFDVETIAAAIQVLAEFNRHDLAAVDIYQGGVKVEIAPAVIDRWKSIGLSNKDFVDFDMPDLNKSNLGDHE